MRRGWKILIAVLVVLAALLAVNTIVVNNQTKDAETTVDGGRILKLPGGDIQVAVQQPTAPDAARGAPIVLLHCYACSLHWFDRLTPLLAKRHEVVRIDLLGHGGSQKPATGYGIEQQASLVAAALDELHVQGAVVVGHSMGFSVATALAQKSSQLVDRLVNIDEGPNRDVCDEPFLAKLEYQPVIGQAMWRLSVGALVKRGYADAFAPGFDLESGFPNPDQVVDDFRAMTYTSFSEAHDANDDFVAKEPLDARVRESAVPLLSIFGTEDQICDPQRSQAAYGAIPGARVAMIRDAGHSPNVEQPRRTAALIEKFAAQGAPPKPVSPPQKPRKPKPRAHRKPKQSAKH